MDQCNTTLGQIQYIRGTNTIQYWDKYNTTLGPIQYNLGTNTIQPRDKNYTTVGQIQYNLVTNTIQSWDKYNTTLGQIQYNPWTNTIQAWDKYNTSLCQIQFNVSTNTLSGTILCREVPLLTCLGMNISNSMPLEAAQLSREDSCRLEDGGSGLLNEAYYMREIIPESESKRAALSKKCRSRGCHVLLFDPHS